MGSANRDERLRTGYFGARFEISENDEDAVEVALASKDLPGLVKGDDPTGVGTFEGGFPSSHGSRDRSEDSGDMSLGRLNVVWLLADEPTLLAVACLLGAVAWRGVLFGSVAEA